MTEARYKNAVSELEGIAQDIYRQMDKGKIPSMKIPVRTKANIQSAYCAPEVHIFCPLITN